MGKAPARAHYHHGDLWSALLKAGLAMVETVPPDEISLKAIATEIGVSQAAPYRHVRNRDAFLAALAASGFADLVAMRDERVAKAGAADRLEAACRAYVAFALSRPGLYRLMFDAALIGTSPKDADLDAVARQSFSGLVDLVAADGRFIDPLASAAFIWSSLHGAIVIHLAGLSPLAASGNADGSDIVDALFRHIGRGTRSP